MREVPPDSTIVLFLKVPKPDIQIHFLVNTIHCTFFGILPNLIGIRIIQIIIIVSEPLIILFQLSQIQHQRSHLHIVVDHGLVAGILNSLAEQCGQAGSLFHRQIVGTSLAAADFLHIVDDGKLNIEGFIFSNTRFASSNSSASVIAWE